MSRGRRAGIVRLSGALAVALALLGAAACSSGDGTGPSSNVPANHTERHGGVAHGVGARQAATQCVSCHGATLQGGTNGEPSCYSCHGKKWQ
ncbi:MAG: hypothetical protein FIA95_10490 [Gemmatimonadetes bacterium]|nr:hypothetical protein [Gemmatimonadota bacterium]